jgi:ketosteroid isomerase-like protein
LRRSENNVTETNRPNRKEEEEVLQLERAFLAACRDADTRRLETLMADRFVFTDPKGLNFTKTEWLSDLRSGDFRFDAIEANDMQVTVRGEIASVTVRLRLRAKSKKALYSGEYSAMDVYERRDGAWQIILSTANQLDAE